MTTLADNIKRLREIAETKVPHSPNAIPNCHGENYQQAIRTINALVELVGEMHHWSEMGIGCMSCETVEKYLQASLTKAAQIAALAKGE